MTEQLIHIRTDMEWISTKDKLPENLNMVCVWIKKQMIGEVQEFIATGYFNPSQGWFILNHFIEDPQFFEGINKMKSSVLFWIDIPTPKKN